jgi:beta-aspartyl-dipeptidase (metallo-type)
MLRLLLNAEVYSPAPLGRRHLVVCGGKLVHLATEPPRLPRELVEERRDLGGLRVIPGLVDAHVHVTGGGGESGPASRVPPLRLSDFTRAGITTVVGVLGTDDLTRTVADLLAATRGLDAEGISAYCWVGGYHLPPATLTGSVRSDIVHLEPVIGAGELAISDHRSSQPTLDELLRLASECHVAGLMTGKAGLLHLHLGDGARGLELVRAALDRSELPPRVFYPTHVNRRAALFAEALELCRRGCSIDVTAFPPISGPERESSDELSVEQAFARFEAAGLPRERLTVSSDGGGSLPSFDEEGRIVYVDVGRPASLFEALRRLVRSGVGLEHALPPFTSNPGELLRLPGKGRLGAGVDADLVVLGKDLEIQDVMARGRWHVRGGAAVLRGRFEDQDVR